jgi:hypothetical protein
VSNGTWPRRSPSTPAATDHQVLFDADDVLSPAYPAIVAIDKSSDILVRIDLAAEGLPIRDGERRPWGDGILVGVNFEEVEPDSARARYAQTSLTRGTARAVIGGLDVVVDGLCYTYDGAVSYGNPTRHFGVDTLVLVQFDLDFQATIEVFDGALYILDVAPVSGVTPVFRVTPVGFAVDGMFYDGQGDEDPVEGGIEVTCD